MGWFGNSNYKKFVIISRSRTGSTLLMAFLRSHSKVHIEGELFKKLNGRTCMEIWEELYSKRPPSVEQVGFKLFYYHPFDEDKSVWDLIKADRSISIIHLRRINLLRAFVSQKIGEKTKKWTQNVKDGQSYDKRIELNAAECKETFETITSYEERTRAQFQDRENYIECTYEDLAADNQGTMNKIFAKLNLPVEEVTTVLKKQNPEPMKNLIVNYDSLQESFANTKWSYLFQD